MRPTRLILAVLLVFALGAAAEDADTADVDEYEYADDYDLEEPYYILGIGDEDKPLSIHITNTAEYKIYDKVMDVQQWREIRGLQTFTDDLTANIYYGDLFIGGTVRLWLPYFDSARTNTLHSANELHKWYFGYSSDTVEARYGTFYSTFGRGLTLDLYNDPILYDIDYFIEGFYGNFRLDWLDVTALAGRGTYPKTLSPHEIQSVDDIRAVQAVVNPFVPWLKLGASVVSMDQMVAWDYETDRAVYKPLTMPSGHIEVLSDYVDLYAEYAMSSGYEWGPTAPDDPDDYEHDWVPYEGSAIYASLVGYLGRNSLRVEYKNYERFDNHWNSPPEVSFSDRPLIKTDPGVDEEGYLVHLTYSPIPGLSFNAGYCDAWDTPGEMSRTEYGGGARWISWPWSMYVQGWFYGEKTEMGTRGDDNYHLDVRDEYWPDLDISYVLDNNHTLALHYRHEFIDKHTISGTWESEAQEQNAIGSFTYSWPGLFSATLGLQYALGDLRHHEEEEGRRYWLMGDVTFNLGPNHDLSIFYGQERGGLTCAGGVCREEPPFEGLRVTLESRL